MARSFSERGHGRVASLWIGPAFSPVKGQMVAQSHLGQNELACNTQAFSLGAVATPSVGTDWWPWYSQYTTAAGPQ